MKKLLLTMLTGSLLFIASNTYAFIRFSFKIINNSDTLVYIQPSKIIGFQNTDIYNSDNPSSKCDDLNNCIIQLGESIIISTAYFLDPVNTPSIVGIDLKTDSNTLISHIEARGVDKNYPPINFSSQIVIPEICWVALESWNKTDYTNTEVHIAKSAVYFPYDVNISHDSSSRYGLCDLLSDKQGPIIILKVTNLN